ncbi:Hypothetical protein KQS_07680 [Flavobacterium indicum GPTSA100-9 = DSM 17447]|uniref:Uncharacterized protein n=1 Tax=Flavobacterium indicum (strain DSM 17447 / CIP 109464 / GPTSA100-9) TaxID=1094466 RepID=H8XSU2_FLAIG|nr:hypothetical protein [Flavobacterium indicum]CCG53484.1 Hypothetical protein KQS_07680 [Flavobacterium indicum GPTSA100-9 = DSM 17447]
MEIEKKDVLNWFWNFRPDLTVDEEYVENLYKEFLQANNKLSLDEITFYGFVVTNYKSEIIDFIYSTLEENWSEVYEKWENENTITFHVKKLKELIDSKDPLENQEEYPHLEFNEDNIKGIYLKIISNYIE